MAPKEEFIPPILKRRATKRRLVIELKDVLGSDDEWGNSNISSKKKRPRKQYYPKKLVTLDCCATVQRRGILLDAKEENDDLITRYADVNDDKNVCEFDENGIKVAAGDEYGMPDMVNIASGRTSYQVTERHINANLPVQSVIRQFVKIGCFNEDKQREESNQIEEDKENLNQNQRRPNTRKRRCNSSYPLQISKAKCEEKSLKEDAALENWTLLAKKDNILREEDAANKNLTYICDENLTSKEIRFRLKQHTRRTLTHCKPPPRMTKKGKENDCGAIEKLTSEMHSYLATTATSKDSYELLKNTSKIIRLENMKRRLRIDMNDHPDRTTIKDRLRSVKKNEVANKPRAK